MPASKKYATPGAFREALETRLRETARAEGITPQRLATLVVFDRLLARLLGGEGPPLVLKGGYAMELRLSRARVSKDVDLSLPSLEALGEDEGKGVEVKLLELLQRLSAREMGDFFEFRVGEATMELDAAPYGGARFPIQCDLDGRRFATFHLDVGTGDAVTGDFEETDGRDWLGFAGVAPPRIRMISREQQFSEKYHAYTLPRQGGIPNTRIKDLVDLVLLVTSGTLDQSLVTKALEATFARRGTHKLPPEVPDPPDSWAGTYRQLATDCGLHSEVVEGVRALRSFLP